MPSQDKLVCVNFELSIFHFERSRFLKFRRWNFFRREECENRILWIQFTLKPTSLANFIWNRITKKRRCRGEGRSWVRLKQVNRVPYSSEAPGEDKGHGCSQRNHALVGRSTDWSCWRDPTLSKEKSNLSLPILFYIKPPPHSWFSITSSSSFFFLILSSHRMIVPSIATSLKS